MEKEIKNENQLERYVQGLKSFGKTFWIGLGLMVLTGLATDYLTKDKKAELYLSGATAVSGIVALSGMIKNRKKIRDCLNPYISNAELNDKYGLTGDNFLYPIN